MGGRLRAWVAGLAAAVALGAAACSGGGSSPPPSTTSTTLPPATTTTAPLDVGEQRAVYRPEVGDCYDRRSVPDEDSSTGEAVVVLVLDCALAHQFEVYAVVDPPAAGPTYPGEGPLRAHAQATCVASFPAYVGRAYEVSRLEVAYELPSPTAWAAGARDIGCLLYDMGTGRMEGTAQGSGR